MDAIVALAMALTAAGVVGEAPLMLMGGSAHDEWRATHEPPDEDEPSDHVPIEREISDAEWAAMSDAEKARWEVVEP